MKVSRVHPDRWRVALRDIDPGGCFYLEGGKEIVRGTFIKTTMTLPLIGETPERATGMVVVRLSDGYTVNLVPGLGLGPSGPRVVPVSVTAVVRDK